jgi:hypothetical protein
MEKLMVLRKPTGTVFEAGFIRAAIETYIDRHGARPTRIAFNDIDATDRRAWDGLPLPEQICGIAHVDAWENLDRHTIALW